MEQNTVRDMKKVSNCFVVSRKISIFAPAILEKKGGNAHFDILQDKQKRAVLIESGKFKVCVNSPQMVALESSLVCPVSFQKDTDCFTIFLTQGTSQNQTRRICEGGVSFFCEFLITKNK